MPKRARADSVDAGAGPSGADAPQPHGSKRPRKVCTCWKYCRGGTERSYTTWKNHKRYRNLPAASQGGQQLDTTPSPSHESIEPDPMEGPTVLEDTDVLVSPPPTPTVRPLSPLAPSVRASPPPGDPAETHGRNTGHDSDSDTEPDFGSDALAQQTTDDLGDSNEDDEHDHEEEVARSTIADLAILQDFNTLLRRASLADCELSPAQLDRLLNPPEEPLALDPTADRILLLCLRTYMTCSSGSHRQYAQHIANMRLAYPEDAELYLSKAQLQDRLEKLTGVVSVMTDMCIDSCVGFTGPWANHRLCPLCSKSRYHSTGKPVKQFSTVLLPQQIQALRRHPEAAKDAQYIWTKLEEIEALIAEHGYLPEYDDIVCGSEIRDAVLRGDIQPNDTVLMVTVDGAQLYRNKASDCWMWGWILVNLHPGIRYKQRYLLPGGFIGGPTKPKIFESFLHIGLRIVSAVNNAGGLRVWDAHSLLCSL